MSSNFKYNLSYTGEKTQKLLDKINNLSKSDVGLDQVDNTSDTDKPVSILQRQALNEVLETAKTYIDREIAEGDGGIKTLSSDEVDTILPTGVYRYEENEHLYLIISKHSEFSNYQTRIDAVYGQIQYRENPFLDGDWHMDSWRGATVDESRLAWKATQAEKALCDMDENIIHLTYATKAEVGDIETALDNIIVIQNSLTGGDSV